MARNIYYRISIYDPLKSCIKYIDTIKGKLDKKYDIIISISDPKSSHLLALALLKKESHHVINIYKFGEIQCI